MAGKVAASSISTNRRETNMPQRPGRAWNLPEAWERAIIRNLARAILMGRESERGEPRTDLYDNDKVERRARGR